MSLAELEEFCLAGGTALALQIGHRLSVDLDFFSDGTFNNAELIDVIRDFAEIRILSQSSSILILNVNGIKTDFVRYRYPLLNPIVQIDDLRLLSTLDIGAMKLAAITNRGRKRDFFDLFFLLKIYSFHQLFDAYNAKYADGSEFLALKSIIYFEDAEEDETPNVFDATVTWPLVKQTIIKEAKNYV